MSDYVQEITRQWYRKSHTSPVCGHADWLGYSDQHGIPNTCTSITFRESTFIHIIIRCLAWEKLLIKLLTLARSNNNRVVQTDSQNGLGDITCTLSIDREDNGEIISIMYHNGLHFTVLFQCMILLFSFIHFSRLFLSHQLDVVCSPQ